MKACQEIKGEAKIKIIVVSRFLTDNALTSVDIDLEDPEVQSAALHAGLSIYLRGESKKFVDFLNNFYS